MQVVARSFSFQVSAGRCPTLTAHQEVRGLTDTYPSLDIMGAKSEATANNKTRNLIIILFAFGASPSPAARPRSPFPSPPDPAVLYGTRVWVIAPWLCVCRVCFIVYVYSASSGRLRDRVVQPAISRTVPPPPLVALLLRIVNDDSRSSTRRVVQSR